MWKVNIICEHTHTEIHNVLVVQMLFETTFHLCSQTFDSIFIFSSCFHVRKVDEHSPCGFGIFFFRNNKMLFWADNCVCVTIEYVEKEQPWQK